MINIIADIEIGPLRGRGPLGLEGEKYGSAAIPIFNKVMSTVIGLMTLIAFIWFIFKLIIGAIGILTSGGDKAKLAEARENITFGLVGVVLVIAAVFIVDLVGTIIGIDIMKGAWFIPEIAP